MSTSVNHIDNHNNVTITITITMIVIFSPDHTLTVLIISVMVAIFTGHTFLNVIFTILTMQSYASWGSKDRKST